MAALGQLLGALSPAPYQYIPNYDGYEFRWKAFVFRPALFKFEALMLGVLGAYVALYFLGKAYNDTRAKRIIGQFQPLISSQFAQSRPILSSGPTKHLLYSTGRRSLLCLHTTLNLLPYHDFITLIYTFGRSVFEPTFDISEGLQFEVTLGRGGEGLQNEELGVWAVIDKSAMRNVRAKRWDLTFPKLQESSVIPVTHSVFTEHSECTEVLLKTPNVGISDLIKDQTAMSVLKYLLITDQPVKRPAKGALPAKYKSRMIVLSVINPTTPAEVSAINAWLQVTLNIADLLVKGTGVRSEVTRKLQATRKTVEEDLGAAYKKELDEDKEPEPTAEEKRFAKKKAERAGLSEKERKKAEELEKKREARKMAKRQQGKGAM